MWTRKALRESVKDRWLALRARLARALGLATREELRDLERALRDLERALERDGRRS